MPEMRRNIYMTTHAEKQMTTLTMTKTTTPIWLLAFWKEIDDKTFGKVGPTQF
jgi:hypothetical protein